MNVEADIKDLLKQSKIKSMRIIKKGFNVTVYINEDYEDPLTYDIYTGKIQKEIKV